MVPWRDGIVSDSKRPDVWAGIRLGVGRWINDGGRGTRRVAGNRLERTTEAFCVRD